MRPVDTDRSGYVRPALFATASLLVGAAAIDGFGQTIEHRTLLAAIVVICLFFALFGALVAAAHIFGEEDE